MHWQGLSQAAQQILCEGAKMHGPAKGGEFVKSTSLVLFILMILFAFDSEARRRQQKGRRCKPIDQSCVTNWNQSKKKIDDLIRGAICELGESREACAAVNGMGDVSMTEMSGAAAGGMMMAAMTTGRGAEMLANFVTEIDEGFLGVRDYLDIEKTRMQWILNNAEEIRKNPDMLEDYLEAQKLNANERAAIRIYTEDFKNPGAPESKRLYHEIQHRKEMMGAIDQARNSLDKTNGKIDFDKFDKAMDKLDRRSDVGVEQIRDKIGQYSPGWKQHYEFLDEVQHMADDVQKNSYKLRKTGQKNLARFLLRQMRNRGGAWLATVATAASIGGPAAAAVAVADGAVAVRDIRSMTCEYDTCYGDLVSIIGRAPVSWDPCKPYDKRLTRGIFDKFLTLPEDDQKQALKNVRGLCEYLNTVHKNSSTPLVTEVSCEKGEDGFTLKGLGPSKAPFEVQLSDNKIDSIKFDGRIASQSYVPMQVNFNSQGQPESYCLRRYNVNRPLSSGMMGDCENQNEQQVFIKDGKVVGTDRLAVRKNDAAQVAIDTYKDRLSEMTLSIEEAINCSCGFGELVVSDKRCEKIVKAGTTRRESSNGRSDGRR